MAASLQGAFTKAWAGQKECALLDKCIYSATIRLPGETELGRAPTEGWSWRATQQGIARSGREECARWVPAARHAAGAAFRDSLCYTFFLFVLYAFQTHRQAVQLASSHPQILRKTRKIKRRGRGAAEGRRDSKALFSLLAPVTVCLTNGDPNFSVIYARAEG